MSGDLWGHALQTAASDAALSFLGLATGVFAARLLGPVGRGELAAIQTWPTFIATLSTLGLGEAIVYYAAQEPEQGGRFIGSALVLALVAAPPFMAVSYFLMPYLLAAQSPGVVFASRCYLLLIPVYVALSMPVQGIRAKKKFGIWNVLRALSPLCWLLVLGIAWALGQSRADFVSDAQLVALLLLCLPVWYLTVRATPGSYRPERKRCGAMLRFGLPSITASIPQILNLRLDQMLMAALLAPRLLGLYAVGVAWSAAGQAVLRALALVGFPHLASLREKPEQQKVLFGRIVRLAVVLAAGVMGCVLPLTPFAVPLIFGGRFSSSVPSAMVLVVAAGILGVNGIIEESIRGLGQPAMVLWAELVGLGAMGVCLWLLLPRMGIMGAALSSLLGYATAGVVLVAEARALTGISVSALLVPCSHEVRALLARVRLLLRQPMSVAS